MHGDDQRIQEEFLDCIAELLKHIGTENQVLVRMEPFFSPKPAKIGRDSHEAQRLNARIRSLAEQLGSPPELIIVSRASPELDHYDCFADAALTEVLNVFHRCRRAVCRAHVSFIGSSLVTQQSEFWDPPLADELAESLHRVVVEGFWEQAEIADIRLGSYWDRVGQLLDFVFFNIRQYDRDTFSAVMDRIHVNYEPLFPVVQDDEGWKALWEFKRRNEKHPDGLGWLLRRRNLLVHSLYLRPLTEEDEQECIFVAAHNHLDASLREKLRLGSMKDELDHLHVQLNSASALFPHVLSLCEAGVEMQKQLHKS